jgi:hypothetical protein
MGLYDADWKRYRMLYRVSLFGFLGALPTCLLVYGLSRLHLPSLVLVPIWIAYVLVAMGVGAWFLLNFFRCPRCNKLFAITWWSNLSIFARKCVHCGLQKFSDGEEQPASPVGPAL